MIYMNIAQSLKFIFSIENINTRQELYKWCGGNNLKKLYLYVERLSLDHWSRLKEPEAYTRHYLQKILSGYKNFKYNV